VSLNLQISKQLWNEIEGVESDHCASNVLAPQFDNSFVFVAQRVDRFFQNVCVFLQEGAKETVRSTFGNCFRQQHQRESDHRT
jgi:hypothetical protein